MADVKGFTFFVSYHKAFKELTQKERGVIMVAMSDYVFEDIAPNFKTSALRMAWQLVEPNLTTSKIRSNVGKLGVGKSKQKANQKQTKSKMKAKQKQNESKPKAMTSYKDKDKDKDKELHESKDSMNNNITFLTEGMSHSDADATKPNTFREKIVAFFNACVRGKNIKPIRSINDGTQRAESLKARRRQYGDDAIEEMFMKAANSSFLNGFNRKGWTATFDWLIRPNNFPKVLEGNYDDEKVNETTIQQTDWQA